MPKKTIGEMFNDEVAAMHAHLDRKEAELDKFGYGGDPSKPPPQMVGIDLGRYGELVHHRPPREDYVRITLDWYGFTIEPAVEYRDGDSFGFLAAQLKCGVKDYGWDKSHDPMEVAMTVARGIEVSWPDRAYFVEVWQEGAEGFAQVFQPFGVPRNR
jgi:hypothetical protein